VIVLEKPKPDLWRFFDFTYSNGNNPIQDWYDGLSDYGRGVADAMLKANHKVEHPLNWVGFRKYLKGEMREIWELGFFDGVQYRILGIFDGPKQAVLLMGCYHKGGNYTPTDALATTLKRKNLWQTGACIKSNERKVKTDQ
jgi:hypothetical protein